MSSNCILDGYVKEPVFAADNNISHRTSARYRLMGMPYLVWGGEVYVNIDGAREWLSSRIKRRNHPRLSRSRMVGART